MLNPTNPQHLQLRRLLAEIVAKHANALATDGWRAASKYRHMAMGMQKVCFVLLQDVDAFHFCGDVWAHLLNMETAVLHEEAAC